mgnify:CR=1 FL=1
MDGGIRKVIVNQNFLEFLDMENRDSDKFIQKLPKNLIELG